MLQAIQVYKLADFQIWECATSDQMIADIVHNEMAILIEHYGSRLCILVFASTGISSQLENLCI